MSDKFLDEIINSAKEVNDVFELNYELYGLKTPLFGRNGLFDSLDLVRFVVILESKVFESTGTNIQLVTDKALSNSRSPFSTVESLLEYMNTLL